MRRWCALWLGILICASALAQPLPPALAEWRGWVLHGQEFRNCPFFAGSQGSDEGDHVCVLSGPVRIAIGNGRATVEQEVERWGAGFVPLVHAERQWPESLSADGRASAVLPGPDGPRTWLEAGRQTLRYELPLASRPESLRVPETFRLVALVVDGRARFPLLREGATLWLDRAEGAQENDRLELEVHRRWSDGIPQQLSTRLTLHVAGKAREVRLGPAWPEGYEPVAVGGALPVTVEPGRMLRVQLMAGSHVIAIEARALAQVAAFAPDAIPEPWPGQEIVSFAADHRLRVVDLGGAAPIDAAQANVPAEWRGHPAFALAPGDTLTLAERSRGLGDSSNRIRLARSLWLDFDGSAWTVQDTLAGQMREGFRLDLGAPFELVAASEQGESLLVTTAPGGGRGIELRRSELSVEATARAPADWTLPAHGWSERLEGIETAVQLPPGWRLVHAGGVDRVGGSWLGLWDIYTVFIAAFTVVLAWRVGGPGLALAAALLALLGAHESEVPRYSLIALLLALLLLRALPAAGRFRRLVAALTLLSAASFAWVALPFALEQARLALYPQLAGGGNEWTAGWNENVVQAQFAEEAMPMAPPPPPPAPAPMERSEVLQSINVYGSAEAKGGQRRKLERYARDTVVQAGVGRPEWRWQAASLGFDGPVEPGQAMALWLSPPWLTALWRCALILALGLIGWQLLRPWRPRVLGWIGLAAGLAIAPGASAAEWPSQEWLDALHARLTEAPRCAPDCARHALADVTVEGRRLRLALEVHAGAPVLVPVPIDERSLAGATLTLDGVAVPTAGRPGEPGVVHVVVQRGVHRIELAADIDSERIVLDFPMLPARVSVAAPGWGVGGVRDGRLASSRLELVREEPVAEAGSNAPARVPVRPFVRVERELVFDLDFTVSTRITRVAPVDGGLSVRIPLLAGEQPTDAGLDVSGGTVAIDFAAGEYERVLSSRLARESVLELAAGELAERGETWRVIVGPSLSAQLDGPPVLAPSRPGPEGEWVHEYAPLPGERLAITLTRPEAVPGASIVADRGALRSQIGRHSREHTLSLSLRATRGGNHVLRLPEGAELASVTMDGTALNVEIRDGALAVPVRPGLQNLEVRWREDAAIGALVRTPAVELGLDAANLSLSLALPDGRWLLATGGPAVGPAVLYWPALAILLLVGWALARSRRALLPGKAWILLALGFSTLSWQALVAVAIGFLLLDLRGRHPPTQWHWAIHNLMQLALAGIALACFAGLVAVIPAGLLGDPDMQLSGGTGSYGELGWLADRAVGALPQAFAFSVPLWIYKGLMLAFALWLALSLVRWGKLAWLALTAGGGWRLAPGWRRRPTASTTPEKAG